MRQPCCYANHVTIPFCANSVAATWYSNMYCMYSNIRCIATYRDIEHHSVRPLTGVNRKEAVHRVVDCKMSPSFLRRVEATEKKGECVPSLHTLQQAKYEESKSRRIDDDVIQSLEKLQLTAKYYDATLF